MHLLFISYEYPPDTGFGGIATYIQQVAELLSLKGNQVHVIAASPINSYTRAINPSLTLTLLRCSSTEEFRKVSPAAAWQLHQRWPIDLIEVPEYGAEALHIKSMLPSVPLAVKLHTPRYLIRRLNNFYYDKLWFRRLKKLIFGNYRYKNDLEYQAIQKADYILSPSTSLRKIVASDWRIPLEKIRLAPNPYSTAKFVPALVPPDDSLILYFGRLETRKGVVAMADAIPIILREFPRATFMFLGRDSVGPFRERSMLAVLKAKLRDQLSRIIFSEAVPLHEIPSILSKAAVVVLPSIWENFPNVCLESMLAGKPVVGSREGGMFDMLQEVQDVSLVDPLDPVDIARKTLFFLNNPSIATEIGLQNQRRAQGFYAKEVIDYLQQSYQNLVHDYKGS
jgi:glycogen synthase